MFKLLQGLTITATFVATLVLALLYASNDLIADTQDPPFLCDDIEEILLESIEEGYMKEHEVIDIVQACRDRNE